MKFNECLSYYDLNAAQFISAAQDVIQKLQIPVVAAKSDISAPLSVLAPKQTVLAKPSNHHEKLMLPNPTDNVDDLSSSSVRIGLPYPNNLKVEKRSETSLLASWDPPTAPLSLSQSIDGDSLCAITYDLNEQAINVQSYNLYLNHEIHSVINGNEDRVAVLEDIDLTMVIFNLRSICF